MRHLSFLRGLHPQALHGFAQQQTAVHALGDLEADLILRGVQLVQALQSAALAIRQPVIAEIAVQDGLVTRSGQGHVVGDHDLLVEQGVRLTRQQARDSAISLLEDAAQQEDADQSVANQASESIQVLASYTLKEAQIENLVTAKGYADCVAFMGDDSLSIVVSTADGTLNSTDVAKITDIAMTETGYAASAIRIMAAN